MSNDSFAPLHVRRNEDRRLRAGHPWVFSNEVDAKKSPLSGFEPGQLVEVLDYKGKSLGTGYINPNSLICCRIVSRDKGHPFSASLIVHRMKVALSLRERLYSDPYYRLVFAESDGLPGLVIDRYGDVVVMQITTAGMELMTEAILEAVDKVIHPAVIYLRNDSPARQLEGLPLATEEVQGTLPEFVEIPEHGTRFRAPLSGGQKTGWFYDQRDNRASLHRYIKGARVLDVFSYVGGWGIRAAVEGASSVTCIDESSSAIEYVRQNATLNGVADRVDAIESDAFEALKALRAERQRFDTVIVDPPAFIKRKKDARKGVEAYRRINQMAMQVLEKDGFLISCSCSHHLRDGMLEQQLHQAARHIDRNLQLVARGGQSSDHPVLIQVPETQYLRAIYSRISLG
ncbi:MAG: class I SAM-dependent rRNA methyltransferase [bacterium]